MKLEKIPYTMINIDPYKLNTVNIKSDKVKEKERKEKEKEKVDEILNKERKKIKKRIKNKEKHDLILKEFDKNQKIRKKMQAMIELQYDKKQKEKSQIKREVQILKDFADDFDPSLYVKQKEEKELFDCAEVSADLDRRMELLQKLSTQLQDNNVLNLTNE